jgi:hypothetical protein
LVQVSDTTMLKRGSLVRLQKTKHRRRGIKYYFGTSIGFYSIIVAPSLHQ